MIPEFKITNIEKGYGVHELEPIVMPKSLTEQIEEVKRDKRKYRNRAIVVAAITSVLLLSISKGYSTVLEPNMDQKVIASIGANLAFFGGFGLATFLAKNFIDSKNKEEELSNEWNVQNPNRRPLR